MKTVPLLWALLWTSHLTHNATAAIVKTAVIGDYGSGSANERAVADMVKYKFQPGMVVTTGDNNYGGPADIDRNIGQFYHRYIGNYHGVYGEGAKSNCFFPALGNHDWEDSDGYRAYLNYFSLPGNERYYDFLNGPIHWFILNSESNEPDGRRLGTRQAQWFFNQISRSTAPWKIVVIHDPPYSSGSGVNSSSQWGFRELGAHAVLSGDSHNYERVMKDGFPYFINGSGGRGVGEFGPIVSGSVVRYWDDYGAMLLTADEYRLTFEFYSIAKGGTLIDNFVLQKAQPVLSIKPALDKTESSVSWSASANGFQLEETDKPAPGNWVKTSGTVNTQNGENRLLIRAPRARKFYRLRKAA